MTRRAALLLVALGLTMALELVWVTGYLGRWWERARLDIEMINAPGGE
jgi:hypothetical protein